jgi:DUF971 family protein
VTRFLEGELETGESLVLAWDSGRRQRLSGAFLRSRCPCETCKMQKPRPQPSEFPGVAVERFDPVGRYALQLQFSDGHRHGAFSFDLLQSFPDEA